MHSNRFHPPRLAGGWSPADVLLAFLFVVLFCVVMIAFSVIGKGL